MLSVFLFFSFLFLFRVVCAVSVLFCEFDTVFDTDFDTGIDADESDTGFDSDLLLLIDTD